MNHLDKPFNQAKGPRITAKQRKIFTEHLLAFQKDRFKDYPRKKYDCRDQLAMDLKKGILVPQLWQELWERNVSITSQIMANHAVYGYISKNAVKEMKSAFKRILNLLSIQ